MRTNRLTFAGFVISLTVTAGCESHRPFAYGNDANQAVTSDAGDASDADRPPGDARDAVVAPTGTDAADAPRDQAGGDITVDLFDGGAGDVAPADTGSDVADGDGGAGDVAPIDGGSDAGHAVDSGGSVDAVDSSGPVDAGPPDLPIERALPRPAFLTIEPASFTFDSVETGTAAASHTFTLRNTGELTAGTSASISSALGGANPGDFSIVAASSTCGSTLAGGDSCAIVVGFSPTADGARAGSLAVSATPGGLVSASLSGSGLRPAAMSGSLTTMSFTDAEIGVATATQTWTITNTGGASTGTLAFTNDNPGEVIVTNNCTSPLAGGAACTIVVAVKATGGGARGATLVLTATRGGSASLVVTARAGYRLSVNIAGTGTVTIQPDGRTCTASCSTLLDPGTAVTLQARPTNGSGFFFSGWGGSCTGLFNDCGQSLSSSINVTAAFAPMTNNLIFVTAENLNTDRHNARGYDSGCNVAANAAGINSASGDAYVSLTSDSSSAARTRLGSARGWVRMDGKPFADTASGLFDNNQVFNSIRYNQHGAVVGSSVTVMTGTLPSGTAVLIGTGTTDNCVDWTSAVSGDSVRCGNAEGGPGRWTDLGATCHASCGGGPYRVICMGKSSTAPVTIAPPAGRLIWLDKSVYVAASGVASPDAQCQSEKPAGVSAAAALLVYSYRSPSVILSATTNYFRPDGVLVGSGAQIASGGALESGIWQNADGLYRTGGGPAGRAFTGATGVSAADTCGDWTSAAGMSIVGDYGLTDAGAWWNMGTAIACNSAPFWYYCVQTAP